MPAPCALGAALAVIASCTPSPDVEGNTTSSVTTVESPSWVAWLEVEARGAAP